MQAEHRYRDLAARRSDPFSFHLAIVLANKSMFLRRLGHIDSALGTIDEALELFGRSAAGGTARPGVYEAAALAAKATHQSAAGDRALAAATGEQAIMGLQAAATDVTAAVRANLAVMKHNQAVHLRHAGDDDAAAVMAREARSLLAQLAQEDADAYIRPLAHMVGRVAGASDPLDHVLAHARIQGRLATSDDVVRLMASADQAVTDQFIDAVIRVCTPVWKDSASAPPDELALRTGDWLLDLADPMSRRGLLACLASASLSTRGVTDAEVAWTAAVLPHIATVRDADVGPQGTVTILLVLDADSRRITDATELHAALPEKLAKVVHRLDVQDLANELSAIADAEGVIVIEFPLSREGAGNAVRAGRAGELP